MKLESLILDGKSYRVTDGTLIDAGTGTTPSVDPVPTGAGYTAKAGKLYDSGVEFQIRGINLSGFQAWDTRRPTSLWNSGWKWQIAHAKEMGFNAFRLPIEPGTLHSQETMPGKSTLLMPDNADLVGKTPLQVLDMWMAEADRQEMRVLIDMHSVSGHAIYFHPYITDPKDYGAGKWAETWNQQPYTTADWLRDLAFVADRYKHLKCFMGLDPLNEPNSRIRWLPDGNPIHAFWKPLVESAYQAISAANPNLLIFVEGITRNDWSGKEKDVPINWGENLQPQAYAPLAIPADKLVFSPHTYGPPDHMKSTFSAVNYPANLADDWEILFGYLCKDFSVVPGEWGSNYNSDATRKWTNAWVNYMLSKGIRNSFYWCYINSHAPDALVRNDLTVRKDVLAEIQRHWRA